MSKIKPYIQIARPDHWIKNFFIVPGILFAYLLIGDIEITKTILLSIVGFFATCFIASANYVINEYLDAEFDKFHPKKKERAAVKLTLNPVIVWVEYAVLSLAGIGLSFIISIPFVLCEAFLLIMGVFYNVKPFRTKDVVFLDVLTESINNAIRLLIGWFVISTNALPPITIVLGFWFGGAFLMDVKRFAEYRMINDKEIAGLYRKSFKKYSEKSLLIAAVFYALIASAFIGIFIIKYKIEMLLVLILLCGLFCYYLSLAYKDDSAVQKPEKLFKEKGLMIYCAIICVVFVVCVFVDIPFLKIFVDSTLIRW